MANIIDGIVAVIQFFGTAAVQLFQFVFNTICSFIA